MEFDGKWIEQDESIGKDDLWGYKVKDMSWSCDSNILAIWVCRRGVDVCAWFQFRSRMEYLCAFQCKFG